MNRPGDRPFDVGLQAERTALAWQRTLLSFAVASLVAARLLLDVFGTGSYATAAAALTLIALAFLLAHRRYRRMHRILVSAHDDRVRLASAAPLLLWAALAFCLAVAGFVMIFAKVLV